MKRCRQLRRDFVCLFSLVTLGWVTPVFFAADPAKAPPSAATPAQSEEEKAGLKVLDRWFSRLDELYEKISDPTYKAMVKENADALKVRREAIRKNFSQSTYEDLKFDTMIEHHRVARWLAEPVVKPSAPPRDGGTGK